VSAPSRPVPTLDEIDAALARFGAAVDDNALTLAAIHAAVCVDLLGRIRHRVGELEAQLKAGCAGYREQELARLREEVAGFTRK
jgi:hypothetical protein